MVQEWEMAMGMDFGMGMGMGASYSATASPEAAAPSAATKASSPASLYGLPSADALRVDDLLDFSKHDLFPPSTETNFFPPKEDGSGSGGSSYQVSDDQRMPSSSGFQSQLSSFDLFIPCEEAAELEWLSKFVDDSFSDVPNYHSTFLAPPTGTEARQLQQEQSIAAPRGARSKRSRVAAAWASALIPQSANRSSSSSSSSDLSPSNQNPGGDDRYNTTRSRNAGSHNGGRGNKGGGGGGGAGGGNMGNEGGVRRCTHCASEKTPQWRTGPLGPKTLCNACGVRYKSGRLVPEYRPAASPTFVLTQHSNSHRKVIELRRQKEIMLLDDATASASVSAMAEGRPELLFEDHHYGVR